MLIFVSIRAEYSKNGKIQGIFKALRGFPELFKEDSIFKDISRKPCIIKFFSGLCKTLHKI